MSHVQKFCRPAWLGGGLIVGLLAGAIVLGRFWPATPLHAVATDRTETFAMATGPIDDEVEAVFLLDFLTGDLRCLVMNKMGKFGGLYGTNVLQDLKIDPSKNPRFMLVTGMCNMQRGGSRVPLGNAIVYVSEITTGRLAAYAIPYNPGAKNTNQRYGGQMLLLDVAPFREAGGSPVIGAAGADGIGKKRAAKDKTKDKKADE